jgi:hypothetical protein
MILCKVKWLTPKAKKKLFSISPGIIETKESAVQLKSGESSL